MSNCINFFVVISLLLLGGGCFYDGCDLGSDNENIVSCDLFLTDQDSISVEEEWIFPNLDTISILNGLCCYSSIFPYKECSNFSYFYNFDKRKKNVVIRSLGSCCDFDIHYDIVLHDENGVYSSNSFFYGDVTFRYVKSSFRVDSFIYELCPEDVFVNASSDVLSSSFKNVEPANIWSYGEDDVSCRCFKVYDSYYFVVRGLNLYCNGSACTSNQIFIIHLDKDGIEVDVFYLATIYPYSVDVFFLYDRDDDKMPEVLIPDVETPENVDDLQWYELRPDGAYHVD